MAKLIKTYATYNEMQTHANKEETLGPQQNMQPRQIMQRNTQNTEPGNSMQNIPQQWNSQGVYQHIRGEKLKPHVQEELQFSPNNPLGQVHPYQNMSMMPQQGPQQGQRMQPQGPQQGPQQVPQQGPRMQPQGPQQGPGPKSMNNRSCQYATCSP